VKDLVNLGYWTLCFCGSSFRLWIILFHLRVAYALTECAKNNNSLWSDFCGQRVRRFVRFMKE